jgi:hypothetical protein
MLLDVDRAGICVVDNFSVVLYFFIIYDMLDVNILLYVFG